MVGGRILGRVVAALPLAVLPVAFAGAADRMPVYAWIEVEQRRLPVGASVELLAIEETASMGTIFTVRYLPDGQRATVTCVPLLDDGWTCSVTRSVFVECGERLG